MQWQRTKKAIFVSTNFDLFCGFIVCSTFPLLTSRLHVFLSKYDLMDTCPAQIGLCPSKNRFDQTTWPALTGRLFLPLFFEVHCYSQCIIQRSSVLRAMILLQSYVIVGSRECSSLDLSSSSSSNWTSSWTLSWMSSLTSQSCISSWTSFRVIFSDEDIFLVIILKQ